jgi:transcriptional regulator with XRE-family HTH domain
MIRYAIGMTGEELRRIRTERFKETQAEFAPRVGLTPNALARLERSERGISRTLAILARMIRRQRPKKRTRSAAG